MKILFFRIAIVFSFLIGAHCVYAQPSFPLPFTGNEAGSVGGRTITAKEYMDMANNIITNTGLSNQKDPLSSDQLHQINKKVWQDLILNAISDNAIVRYKLSVTDSELITDIENYPPQAFKSSFIDSAGVFHKGDFVRALHDPKNDTVIRAILPILRTGYLRKKLSEKLLGRVTISEEEAWHQFHKEKPKATKADFQKTKEKLTEKYLEQKKRDYIYKWIEDEKAHAKIVDMRKVEGR